MHLDDHYDDYDDYFEEETQPSQSTPFPPRDPKWTTLSASLRPDPQEKLCLYFKIPKEKILDILNALEFLLKNTPVEDQGTLPELLSFLKEQQAVSTNASLFYSVSAEEARNDADSINLINEKHSRKVREILRDYMKTIHLGLQNHELVDWIARCGGPKYAPDAALESEQ